MSKFYKKYLHEGLRENIPAYPGIAPNSHYGDYYYPSLWGYYNLMPTQLRNHAGTMAALRGIEKFFYKVRKILWIICKYFIYQDCSK